MVQLQRAILAASLALTASDLAHAQEASRKLQDRVPALSAPIVNAAVDANGRVVPTSVIDNGAVQRVGDPAGTSASQIGPQTGKAVNPCPGASVLSQEEGARIVETVANEQRFAPAFVRAVARAESRFVSNALSQKGAYGLMQLLPDTAASYGVNICDPADNVKGGIAFLRDLHRKYPNPIYMLAAYNAGEVAVLKYKGVPPYAETVGYIASVINDFYQWPSVDSETVMPSGASPLGRPDVLMTASGAPDQRNDPISRTKSVTGISGKRPEGAAPAWQGGMVQNFD